ncbi:MAG: glycerophosphodiester phosphodiesterase [Candidatus Heimdallarchaeota archaeon]|nr:MAG: glycerophosphodiester phosphodiesterase [Candidatus Heimdallarchaeota archaeon]
MNHIKIIAHRGYLVNGEPENSIPAFQTAIHHGADGFEFDVHLTSDNRLICFHDDTLEKLGRPESIENLSLNEVTSIELSEGITIPSLEEVFETFGNKAYLNLEMKNQKEGAKNLVEVINQYDLKRESIIISSFHHSPLKKIKTFDPTIQTGLLCHSAKDKLKIAEKLNCNALHPFYGSIPDEWIKVSSWLTSKIHKYYAHKSFKVAKKIGILINPYGVNEESFIRSTIQMKVNAIITDEVERAFKLRNQFSK